jgi:hypothetical protein
MSALGHKRTFCDAGAMSALPPSGQWMRLSGFGLFAARFGLRQALCRIPSIVGLMPFSSLVGLPIFPMRFERYFGCPC